MKPQFELCPKKVKKGIVRDREHRKEAVLKVASSLRELGFNVLGVVKSFPRGSKGNEEFFLLAGREGMPVELERGLERALDE